MPRPHDDRGAFRCTIPPENAAARLKVGSKWHDVAIQDASRSGYTVQVPQRVAKKIKDNARYVLKYRGEEWEIERQSSFSDSDEHVNVGFSRIRELTKLTEPKSSIWSFVPQVSSQTDPTFLFFLMLAFLIACLSLPGVGDGLGTAPKIQKGVRSVVDSVKDSMK